MTRQDILNSLSARELADTVADRMVLAMTQEAESIGGLLSDYDVDSFCDQIDDFSVDVTSAIKRRLPE